MRKLKRPIRELSKVIIAGAVTFAVLSASRLLIAEIQQRVIMPSQHGQIQLHLQLAQGKIYSDQLLALQVTDPKFHIAREELRLRISKLDLNSLNSNELLRNQYQALKNSYEVGSIVDRLIYYDPQLDLLAGESTGSNANKLLIRLRAAKTGIAEIQSNLFETTLGLDLTSINTSIAEINAATDELIIQLESQQFDQAQLSRSVLFARWEDLQSAAWELEQQPVAKFNRAEVDKLLNQGLGAVINL